MSSSGIVPVTATISSILSKQEVSATMANAIATVSITITGVTTSKAIAHLRGISSNDATLNVPSSLIAWGFITSTRVDAVRGASTGTITIYLTIQEFV